MVIKVLYMYFEVLIVEVVIWVGSYIHIYTLLFKFSPSFSLPLASLHPPLLPTLSLILSLSVMSLSLSLITY